MPRIFAEYLSGRGIWAIAEGLTADGVPSPSGHDPARNRHRIGVAWSKGAVRAILLNPRYTGRQVWNKQRKEEILLDVEDVAAGHETKMRWNTKADWIWSQAVVHEPLVEDEVFRQVQELFAARGRTPAERKVRPASRPYALRGLMTCGLCGRKMESLWANERAHYRCRYPREYAASRALDHPKNVILREDVILPTLDRWLASLFDEEHRDATIDALAEHQVNPVEDARLEAARRRLQDCDHRLAKYRAGLEAGMDATLVAQWTAEVNLERRAAEIELQPAPAKTHRLTREEIATIVDSLRSAYALLRRADSASKAAVYQELGLRMTFRPSERLLLASVTPGIGISSCPRGDSHHIHMDCERGTRARMTVCWSSGGLCRLLAPGRRWGSGGPPGGGRLGRCDQGELPGAGAHGDLKLATHCGDVLLEDAQGDVAGAFDRGDPGLADSDALGKLSLGQPRAFAQRRQPSGQAQLVLDDGHAIGRAGGGQDLLLPRFHAHLLVLPFF